MIPSNELRIGNYINFKGKLEVVCLINFDYYSLNTSSIGLKNSTQGQLEDLNGEDVQAVILTDQILEQCGFTYHSYFKFWQLIRNSSETRSELDIDKDYNIIDFTRRTIVKNITSLHQLQNIYFALKGHEIEFQLSE